MRPTLCRSFRTLATLVAMGFPALPATAAEGKAAGAVIAEERLGPMSFALDAQIVYERATLRIVGPEGYEVRKRFAGGAPIMADLLGDRAPAAGRQRGEHRQPIVAPTVAEPGVLVDGRYRYEAVFLDAAGEEQVVSGLFFVEGGVAVSREQMRGRLTETRSELRDRERIERSTQDGLAKVTAAANEFDSVVILDTAEDGYTFLTLISNANPPDAPDWTWLNGAGDFHLAEDPGSLIRATFLPGGFVGIGTTAPSRRLHVRDAFGAQLLLDTGLDHMNLDLYDDVLSFIDDDGEPIVRFIDSAPLDRLVVAGGGVGIDTDNPGANLHIFGTAGQDIFSAVGPDPAPGGNALNFGYSGFTFGSGSGFFNVRPGGATAINPALYFATGNIDRLLIDNQGFLGVHLDGILGPGFNPSHPIHSQTSGAHLTAGGIWTNASSRELKEGITPLNAEAALTALAKLEPVSFRYKLEPEDEHAGFIAEDVPELVANPDRKTLSPMDVVAVLTRVVQEQQRALEEQEGTVVQQRQALQEHRRAMEQQHATIAALSRRVEELEQSSKPE